MTPTNSSLQSIFVLVNLIDRRNSKPNLQGGILPKVKRRSDESDAELLRRFRKEVIKSRKLTDARRKRWFVSNSELRRIKEKKAARRRRRVERRTPRRR